MNVGIQAWTTDVKSIEGAAAAKRGAYIKTGPYRTEIFGGDGNRQRLRGSGKRNRDGGDRKGKEEADTLPLQSQIITLMLRVKGPFTLGRSDFELCNPFAKRVSWGLLHLLAQAL